ncbi:hypothetical protein Aduo_018611 [Ancylostoma duodenale]
MSNNVPVSSIPLIEMQHLGDTIAFRQMSNEVLESVLDRDYEEADAADVPRAPAGVYNTILIPPIIDRVRPVL